ncbi:hypothetical protein NL676_013081 [Syzygium grande]|nr:hypothetical protein NL676_013081 [Syzygium grande]
MHEELDELRSFKEGRNTLNGSNYEDVEAMIELFEASHLASEGENILDEVKAFSTGILPERVSGLDGRLLKRAVHALELPMHWRVQWFDIKWQIDLWWKDLGLIEHVDFAKDRLVESFLCALGLSHEPRFSSLRKSLTKVIILIMVIDDVYDLFGSLEELECFTGAITSGQIFAKRYLLKQSGTMSATYHIWKDLLERNKDVIYNVSMIFQLCNDLATSTAERDRGDAPSSVVCYMREANVSEHVARKQIKVLINHAWKSFNAHCFGNAEMLLLRPFIDVTVNVARVAHMFYQFGDGIGI